MQIEDVLAGLHGTDDDAFAVDGAIIVGEAEVVLL